MFKIALIVLSVFLSGSAFAGYAEGLAAYKNGDYEKSISEFRPLAEQGEAIPQLFLGDFYYNGQGVEKDVTQAVQWYQKAAEQGNAAGQITLAKVYYFGLNGKKEPVKALEWFRKAAEKGNGEAQLMVGAFYYDGDSVTGIKQDFPQAFEWLSKASKSDEDNGIISAANYYLGQMYFYGKGVNKDLTQAKQLTELSGKQGNKFAKEFLPKLQKQLTCLKSSSTQLFGEVLSCTNKKSLRSAAKIAGASATREDDGYWYDLYDSGKLLEGTDHLSIAYINDKFAKAYYEFNSGMDTRKVAEVRDMLATKYGRPTTSSGDVSLGPVTYTWKLKDGIKLIVNRDWPDTTVYLTYIHTANFADMEKEQARQKQAEEEEKRNKQSKAF